MNAKLRNDILLRVARDGRDNPHVIALTNDIVKMVDKDFAEALTKSMSYGELLDACDMEIRSKY